MENSTTQNILNNEHGQTGQQPPPKKTGTLLGGLALISIGMFAFAIFVMPPMYDVFCEITGLNGKSDSLARQSLSDFNPENLASITDRNAPSAVLATQLFDQSESSTQEQKQTQSQEQIRSTETALNNDTLSTNTAKLDNANNTTSHPKISLQFLADTHPSIPWEFKPSVFSMKIEPGKRHLTHFYVKNLSGETIKGQAVPSVTPGHMAQYLKKIECFCFTQQTLTGHEEKEMPLSFYVSEDAPSDISTITLSYMLYNMNDK